jgi:hypothetical protein
MPDKGAGKQKRVDLGASGSVTFHLSANQRSLLIAFDTEPEGLDKTGVNTFIDALKKVREKMQR